MAHASPTSERYTAYLSYPKSTDGCVQSRTTVGLSAACFHTQLEFQWDCTSSLQDWGIDVFDEQDASFCSFLSDKVHDESKVVRRLLPNTTRRRLQLHLWVTRARTARALAPSAPGAPSRDRWPARRRARASCVHPRQQCAAASSGLCTYPRQAGRLSRSGSGSTGTQTAGGRCTRCPRTNTGRTAATTQRRGFPWHTS